MSSHNICFNKEVEKSALIRACTVIRLNTVKCSQILEHFFLFFQCYSSVSGKLKSEIKLISFLVAATFHIRLWDGLWLQNVRRIHTSEMRCYYKQLNISNLDHFTNAGKVRGLKWSAVKFSVIAAIRFQWKGGNEVAARFCGLLILWNSRIVISEVLLLWFTFSERGGWGCCKLLRVTYICETVS